MPPKKVFHPRRPIIAILKQDNLWRRAAVFGKVEKIRVSRYDNETVSPRIIPNGLVRSEPREACVENVRRAGEKFRKATDKLRRKVRVKQKLQRDMRSRPVCEA
jgi:hypothetical protein